MDNNRKDPASMVEGWLDEILKKLDNPEAEESSADQLGPDEQAVASAGLTHPDDMELERIVQETIAENWGDEFPEESLPQEASDGTRSFQASQENTPVPSDTEDAQE